MSGYRACFQLIILAFVVLQLLAVRCEARGCWHLGLQGLQEGHSWRCLRDAVSSLTLRRTQHQQHIESSSERSISCSRSCSCRTAGQQQNRIRLEAVEAAAGLCRTTSGGRSVAFVDYKSCDNTALALLITACNKHATWVAETACCAESRGAVCLAPAPC
jgi:hypothetical protein